MIVEFEDSKGNTIGAVHLYENDFNGEVSVKDVTEGISIADIELDDIFDTNEQKVRIQLEEDSL